MGKIGENPDISAWLKWREENPKCFERFTLGPSNQFLEKRLLRAFMDGVKHGRKTPDVRD